MRRLPAILIILTTAYACSNQRDDHKTTGKHDIKNATADAVEGTNRRQFQQPQYVKGLSALDRKKFIFNDLKMHKNTEEFYKVYDSLPTITEVPDYENSDARYYSDLTFSKNFNTYVIGFNEGGDCGPSQTLITCKGDSMIATKTLMHECAWENGRSELVSEFLNDSTFKTVTTTRDAAQDSTGYIPGMTLCGVQQETFLIEANGGLRQIAASDTSWREKKN